MTRSLFLGVRAVLFDLDGTLVDTVGDLAASVNHALRSLGRPERSVEEIRGFIGEGVSQLLRDALGPGHEGLVSTALERFTPHYLAHCTDRSVLYPGAAETLGLLAASRRLGVVTNKPEAPSRRILQALGVSRFFEVLIGGDTLPVKKPDPAPVREAARRLGLPSEACLLVGDAPGDVAAAHGAGALAVGATFGYRPAAELSTADARVGRLADIVPLLEDRP